MKTRNYLSLDEIKRRLHTSIEINNIGASEEEIQQMLDYQINLFVDKNPQYKEVLKLNYSEFTKPELLILKDEFARLGNCEKYREIEQYLALNR